MTKRWNSPNNGTLTSSGFGLVLCLVNGWQGAHPQKSNGSLPHASTNGRMYSVETSEIFWRRKGTPRKFALKVFAESASRSSAKVLSIPAFLNPALVPPHPEKKSKTLIGMLGIMSPLKTSISHSGEL